MLWRQDAEKQVPVTVVSGVKYQGFVGKVDHTEFYLGITVYAVRCTLGLEVGMSSALRILIGVVVVVLVALGIYWILGRGGTDEGSGAPAEVVEVPTEVPTPSLEERLSERLKGTTLAGSDAIVREMMAALSSQPEVVVWLANEDLVRRFVASVNLVSEGKSPRSQLEFLKPKGRFSVDRRGEGWVTNQKGFRRYNTVAEAFTGLDVEGAVRVFSELEPLIDEAQREIAPPGVSFRMTLKKAINHLLAVPVLQSDPPLDLKVVTYSYQDPSIEGLSEAQKQLLRMGPENVMRVQAKLRELEAGLGL